MNDDPTRDPPAPGGAHEAFRELLALALYDELDAEEAARLREHLARCAACLSEQRALADGLGALRPAAIAASSDALSVAHEVDDEQGDWARSLQAALHAETTATAPGRAPILSLARGALLAAAGFAAGLLFAAVLRASTPDLSPLHPSRPEPAPVAVGPPAFSLPEPPPSPLPRSHRSLAGLGLLLAR